jgi:hypothetical protein
VGREVAAELVGDLPHERDLVAEAFWCRHDLPPRWRVRTRHAIQDVRRTALQALQGPCKRRGWTARPAAMHRMQVKRPLGD